MCFHGLVYIVACDWSPGFQAGGVVGDEAGATDRGWIKKVWEPPYKVGAVACEPVSQLFSSQPLLYKNTL